MKFHAALVLAGIAEAIAGSVPPRPSYDHRQLVKSKPLQAQIKTKEYVEQTTIDYHLKL